MSCWPCVEWKTSLFCCRIFVLYNAGDVLTPSVSSNAYVCIIGEYVKQVNQVNNLYSRIFYNCFILKCCTTMCLHIFFILMFLLENCLNVIYKQSQAFLLLKKCSYINIFCSCLSPTFLTISTFLSICPACNFICFSCCSSEWSHCCPQRRWLIQVFSLFCYYRCKMLWWC